MSVLGRFFDSNEGELRRLKKVVQKINVLEASTQALSGDALRARTAEFRERIAKGETLDDILPEAFAAVREAARRTLSQRHFDEQLMGAWRCTRAISGDEDREKELVAQPRSINALATRAHTVTTNDNSQAGAGWMAPITTCWA